MYTTYSSRFRDVASTNKVLRNTFALLALSMIPTVFGVWASIQLGIAEWITAHPIAYVIGFLVAAFALIFATYATKDSAFGLVPLGFFTLLMGASMSGAIAQVLGKVNGAAIIFQAAAGTGVILAGCSAYAMTTKRDFSFLGGFLFGSLLAVIGLSLLNAFVFQMPGLVLAISCITLVLFTAYIIYDVQQIVNGGETNYIIATIQLYLDVLNVFMSLLNILSSSDD